MESEECNMAISLHLSNVYVYNEQVGELTKMDVAGKRPITQLLYINKQPI